MYVNDVGSEREGDTDAHLDNIQPLSNSQILNLDIRNRITTDIDYKTNGACRKNLYPPAVVDCELISKISDVVAGCEDATETRCHIGLDFRCRNLDQQIAVVNDSFGPALYKIRGISESMLSADQLSVTQPETKNAEVPGIKSYVRDA